MTPYPELVVRDSYALGSAWHAERERLESITRLYDPPTLELCQRLGARNGWRCLDVGAGTGSLASALTGLVAPAGSVMALDIDTRFLEPLGSRSLLPASISCTHGFSSSTSFSAMPSSLILSKRRCRADGC
jgi:hypothetical protein